MKKLFFIGLLLVLSTVGFSNDHKYYVSMTEIVHEPGENKISVSVKVFLDDLQEAILLDEGVKITDPLLDYAEQYSSYFNRHLKVIVNGKTRPFKFVGIDDTAEAVKFLFEINDAPEQVNDLDVKCTLLLAVLPQQTNFINYFAANSKRAKGLLLNARRQEGKVKL